MIVTGLVERLEKATGPDREIDGLIVLTFYGWTFQKMKGDSCPYWREQNAEWYQRKKDGPPKVTASLDAALALVERVLPGWFPSIGQNIHYGHWRGSVRIVEETNGDITSFDGEHRTSPALALCLAALKAIQQTEGAK
jgi:hypothetical protein